MIDSLCAENLCFLSETYIFIGCQAQWEALISVESQLGVKIIRNIDKCNLGDTAKFLTILTVCLDHFYCKLVQYHCPYCSKAVIDISREPSPGSRRFY